MVPVAEAVDADWREYGVQSSREELEALRPVSQDGTVTEDIGGYRVAPVPPGIKVRLDNASSGRIHAGIRLHSVLSRITDSRDVDRVIADALKHGVITRDADDPCGIDNVNALVREPIMAGKGAVATWFDPANKVYSERTITSAGSSLWDDGGIENLRPDRIVRRPDGQILVIDYKTGDQRRDKKYCGQGSATSTSCAPSSPARPSPAVYGTRRWVSSSTSGARLCRDAVRKAAQDLASPPFFCNFAV